MNPLQGLTYTRKSLGSCIVLELSGAFCGRNLAALREEVKSLAETQNAYIIFDLFDVTLVDSAGLGFFIRSLDQIRSSGGNLAICRVEYTLQKILSLIRLPMEDSVEEAVVRLEREGEHS